MSLLNTALLLTTVTTALVVVAVIAAGGAAAGANPPAVVPGVGERVEAADCGAAALPPKGVRVVLAPMAGLPEGCRATGAAPGS